MTARLFHGDCREVLRSIDAESLHACVTDPPYELGFMGKAWDRTGVAFDPRTWQAVWRVLKPGAHLLAFGGARTYHRLATAIEDAGFEIRDQIMWLFGTGFPKSHNLEDERDGWGTALKPAHEPIVVARKPLRSSVAATAAQHGVGALNIDGCRIPVTDQAYARNCSGDRGHAGTRSTDQRGATDFRVGGASWDGVRGRWPANVCHDGSGEVMDLFPAEAGAQAPVHRRGADKFSTIYGAFAGNVDEKGSTFRGDGGSAARFYYCAKATRRERNLGLAGMPEKPLLWSSGTKAPGTFQRKGTHKAAQNNHPTVKPVALMRWLCRLVTPKGGTVLDPFLGSGSTAIACEIEQFHCVGIELDAAYHEIAGRRIAAGTPLLAELSTTPVAP